MMVLFDFSFFLPSSSLSGVFFFFDYIISIYTPIPHLDNDSTIAAIPKLNPILSKSISLCV